MPKASPKNTSKPKKATPKVVKTPMTKPPVKAKTVKEQMVKAIPAPAVVKNRTGTYFYAAGKRKTSIASVRLFRDGKGVITVNNRSFENYFPVFTDQDKILSPLRITNTQKLFDIFVKVFGGGIHSQAEAVRHGIAKALLEYDANLRSSLKQPGFLTRDSRIKERKKYGLKRARRAPQWQKR